MTSDNTIIFLLWSEEMMKDERIINKETITNKKDTNIILQKERKITKENKEYCCSYMFFSLFFILLFLYIIITNLLSPKK